MQSKMMLPKIIAIPATILAVWALIAGYCAFINQQRILSGINASVSVLTLAALWVYVYYTYRIARDPWIPCASSKLERDIAFASESGALKLTVTNHSKSSLRCRCILNATVLGQKVSLDEFLDGEVTMDLQPYGTLERNFRVEDILCRINMNSSDMMVVSGKGANADPKEKLRMDIILRYHLVGEISAPRNVRHNPKQVYYYDFVTNRLVSILNG